MFLHATVVSGMTVSGASVPGKRGTVFLLEIVHIALRRRPVSIKVLFL